MSPNGMVLPWNDSRLQVSISMSEYTHMRPRKGQAVSKLPCFLDQEGVFLPAELICADKTSNVTDGALKDAATRHQHRIQLSCGELHT